MPHAPPVPGKWDGLKTVAVPTAKQDAAQAEQKAARRRRAFQHRADKAVHNQIGPANPGAQQGKVRNAAVRALLSTSKQGSLRLFFGQWQMYVLLVEMERDLQSREDRWRLSCVHGHPGLTGVADVSVPSDKQHLCNANRHLRSMQLRLPPIPGVGLRPLPTGVQQADRKDILTVFREHLRGAPIPERSNHCNLFRSMSTISTESSIQRESALSVAEQAEPTRYLAARVTSLMSSTPELTRAGWKSVVHPRSGQPCLHNPAMGLWQSLERPTKREVIHV